ncbi:S8 family serine peptidase [Streptomyces sp. NPDC094143]|uniref:S8 family serine peptidase n=1 Tax=Streptomyces sp. NPDC094143 TaxID=3155310 RepID=UPI003332576E
MALSATALLAVPLPAAAAPGADGEVRLPQVRSRLEPDQPCAKASKTSADRPPWPYRALALDRVWRLSRGEGVTVAVVDTGVGGAVPALAGRVTALADAGEDCVGHGTFAAGLIGAAQLPGVGFAGVAPRVRVLAVRGTDLRGDATAGRVALGIRQAADAGAEVIYVASALTTGRAELTRAAAYAAGRDALVVAPAVPDSVPDDADTGEPIRPRPYWPAFAPRVLSVVDHGPGGARPQEAPEVFAADLAAPGGAVVSLGPRGAGHYIGSGSSLAAAHVAGAAALLRAYHPRLDAAEVSRRLVAFGYPADVPQLDPYAALTAVPAGAPGRRPNLADVTPPERPATAPRTRALVVAAVGTALVLLVAALGAVIPRGRARGWRPGERWTTAASGGAAPRT